MIFIDSPSPAKGLFGWEGRLFNLGSRIFPAVFAAFLGMLVCLAPNNAAAETGNALPLAGVQFPLTDTSREIREKLTVLSDGDARLYREIFRLQEGGEWKAADKRIKQLSDRLLMGHVLYQRYMHPRAYRSRYEELKDWMRDYADHPEAARIYKLAVKRRPANWKWPRKPSVPSVRISWTKPAPQQAEPANAAPRRSVRRRNSRDLRYAERRIARWLRMGAPTRALEYLETKSVSRHFDSISYDAALSKIARAYYHADKNLKALELGLSAADRSGEWVPDAHWWAGLVAWRLRQYDVAAEQFAALANSRTGDSWLVSAGAYWAARAYLVDRQPDKVVSMLQLAAEHPMTFYGVLGQEALALEHAIDWQVPGASPDAARQILNIPAARRGLALMQIGKERQGLSELKRVFSRMPPDMLQTLMAFADNEQIAALSYQVGHAIKNRDGHRHNAALFPLPGWEPNGGFQVDRALIFALMRQESNFKTEAKSHAGARGLMQLMPGTAGFISGKRYRGWRRDKLYDPELNVTLGQKYIRHLLNTPGIDQNLFMAVAAYNGGPGNLRKWMRGVDFRNDPLLFIESIPNRETRGYVEKVLTNYWIYRDRLGQPRPSLRDVVAGDWPVYTAHDPLNRQVVAFNRTTSEN
jgi:soluble lytic murein transglycosylase-like protein